jgi:hypothetical protein
VGTGREQYMKSTRGWVNGHRIKVMYGDSPIGKATSRSWGSSCQEELLCPQLQGQDGAGARGGVGRRRYTIPTHMLVMASSGCGTAYTGTEGMKFYIDNLALVF